MLLVMNARLEKCQKVRVFSQQPSKFNVAAFISLLNGEDPVPPSLANTFNSCVTPDHNILVAAVYHFKDDSIVGVKGG